MSSNESDRQPSEGSHRRHSDEEPLLASPSPPPITYTHKKLQDDGTLYRVCMDSIHLVHAVPLFIIIKCVLYLILLIPLVSKSSSLVIAFSIFTWILVALTGLTLYAGLIMEKYVLIIPSLFVSFLTVFLLSLHTFVKFLQLTSLREELTRVHIMGNVFQFLFLIFEMYYLYTVSRTFVYICDVRMNKDIHDRRRKHTIVKGRVVEAERKFTIIYEMDDDISHASLEDFRMEKYGQKKKRIDHV
ncbi:hypothetical protein PRIPAC_93712 [Pristionchus pacificus]|uniref:Uncharacterized protein n=1 Tax=Pristionchus pacificus TaxID=54126 RepID=A0A2A6BB95_PRIPA|nr:hypothetical protein PRIPAC_93712 [Pristionchus pacificus]|eukprot:PDM63159.1 hypothetical protein PRIPAC_50374 [Pristionchus pacificus]